MSSEFCRQCGALVSTRISGGYTVIRKHGCKCVVCGVEHQLVTPQTDQCAYCFSGGAR